MPRAGDTIYGQVSPFWNGLLQNRQNFLEPYEFNFFRNPGTSGTYGIGDSKDVGDDKKLFESSILEIVDSYGIPDNVISEMSEPFLGSPTVLPYRDNLFSQNFLKSLAAAWRVRQILNQQGVSNRPLRVCEIGAGFGATGLALHHLLNIEHYTIIDIAENLYQSSIFLPLCLPDRSHQFVTNSSSASLACYPQLNFSLPSFTDALGGTEFDLVLNNASFGEMPRTTAQAYIRWIQDRLSENGIVYSLNRHNAPGVTGVTCLSEYGFQNFHIHSLSPMNRMTRPQNQIASEIVASLKRGDVAIDETSLDAIGDLIMCGFENQIERVIQLTIHDKLDAETRLALHQIADFFRLPKLLDKYGVLQQNELAILPEIKKILLTVIELVARLDAGPTQRKEEVLSMDLGTKMDMRLRGLYAEREMERGEENWRRTLNPIREYSHSLHGMSERIIAQGKRGFASMFLRDLKVSPQVQ